MKRDLAAFFFLALVIAIPGTATAHDVSVWAEVAKGKVHVEAYFSDGTPVGDVPVTVSNSEGKVLLTGRTSAKGVFDFDPPVKAALTITVSVGGGHDASARIKAKDLE